MAAAAFLLWSGAFVFGSSFVALDGRRYFCLFDDAMISMRYAWNLSHGAGLVWNPGERVEGYTSLLMTLVMSAATAILDKVRAVAAVQAVGAATSLGVALMAVRVSRLVFPGRSITPVGIALLAYYPLAYWSLMGMESGLLALEVTAGLAAAIGYVQTHSAERLRALTALLALAFLTRPDAVLFGVPLIIYVAPESARARQLRPLCLAIALLLFVAVAHTVFRQIYYGHPLPNSYYLKLAGIPLADRVANGASFIAPFVSTHAVLLSGALVGGWIDRRRETLLLAALPVLALVYQLWIGGDPWPYWRFLTPAIPALLVLCVGMLMSVAPRRAWAYCAVVFALFLADRPFLPEMLLFARPFQVMENESNVNMAVAIDELTTPEASVGGCWSGAIPYYTGRRAVDFLGKSDAHIARLPPDLSGSVSWAGMRSVPGHNKYDLAYSIQGLRPTWVERFAWGRQDLSGWGREHYETIDYRGWMLHFRRGAPEVLWRKAWPWLH